MLGQNNLLYVVSQLEVGDIILLLLRNLLTPGLLGLPVLLFLVELLLRLLGPARKVLGADLSAENARLCPVLALYAKRHLSQNEFRLFPPVHGAKRLDLKLA